MTESERFARNHALLVQLNPVFRARISDWLVAMELGHWRPRLQQAWRSPDEQLEAYRTGHSKLKWGYHNATTPEGFPDALAVDVVDDDAPLSPSSAFIIAAAHHCLPLTLTTGVEWGLPVSMRAVLRAAILSNAPWSGKIGWDPLHIECADLTVAAARAGKRPPPPNSPAPSRT